jgi:hypothetical protein
MKVVYHTGSSFSNSYTNPLQFSIDGTGTTWTSTGFTPVYQTSDNNPAISIDLSALGVDTLTGLQNLQLKYLNSQTSNSNKLIYFDLITLDISWQYNDSIQLSWIYELASSNAYPYHNLTINATCSGSQNFYVDYSNDGITYVNGIITISGSVAKNYSYNLPANTGANYYIRIWNAVAVPSDIQSVTLTVLNINHYRTPDYPATVAWNSANTIHIDITDLGAERITCIALGDFGNAANTGKTDGLLDILISTTNVGSTSKTLYLKMQNPGGGFSAVAPQAIDTSSMASNVGGSYGLYDTQAIEVGDFNGDKVTDIVLVIGFASGRSGGTAASLWLYINDGNTNTLQFSEQSLNMLNSGESGINVKTGEISLSFLFPVFGVLLIPIAEAAISRKKKQ